MPVKLIFTCQFCGCRPEPETQKALERQVQDVFFGRYVDAGPDRWLIWHGRGPLGPMRYACGMHRGELTAYLRHHYGSVAPMPWKWALTRGHCRAAGRSSGPSWGAWAEDRASPSEGRSGRR